MDDFYGQESKDKTYVQIVDKAIRSLNDDQKKAFSRISDAILGRSREKHFFIEGEGGTGKTFLYNTLIRWCLSGKPMDVLPLAASDRDDDSPLGASERDESRSHDDDKDLCRGSVIAAASTGIAGLLLIGGGTAHRHFCIPNDVDDKTPPKIAPHTTRAQQIRKADLIIIDVSFCRIYNIFLRK